MHTKCFRHATADCFVDSVFVWIGSSSGAYWQKIQKNCSSGFQASTSIVSTPVINRPSSLSASSVCHLSVCQRPIGNPSPVDQPTCIKVPAAAEGADFDQCDKYQDFSVKQRQTVSKRGRSARMAAQKRSPVNMPHIALLLITATMQRKILMTCALTKAPKA